MATLTIASFPIQNFHRPGIFARLKIWFGQDFVTAAGQLVMGGTVRSGSIYVDQLCSLDADTHILTIPDIALPTTNDSSVRNVRATALLFDASGAFVRNLFTGWIIPEQLSGNTDFAALNAYNAANPRPPDPTYPSSDQILTLVNSATARGPLAAVGVTGIAQLSWTPDDPDVPIALSANDPRVGNLRGELTANTIPKGTGTETLADSQITDDGVDVTVQTLNNFQAGDCLDQQNGSYIDVNDGLGRVNFFAGGGSTEEPASQYAGVAAVADETTGTMYLQTTGYNHLVGSSDGLTKLGDALAENNGTRLEIDDVNEWIKLHNLPDTDPGELNALWRDGTTIKISAG